MTTPHLRLIWLPFNLHQTRSFRSAVPATCEPRSAASSPRVADGSLGQLPQKGSRRLFARFCASCRRHYQRAAAVSCRGGGRRPRYRLRFAPALRDEIQRGSSVQQSHTLLLLYSPIFVLAAAAERRVDARLARCGLPPPVATSWACAINTPPSVFNTQNQPPNKRQSAVLSAARSALCALLNPRHTSRSPSQRAGRHGCRQRRPSRRLGSLVSLQARSRPYDMPPSRGVGRLVRPCDGPAGMATPTPSGLPHRLTFHAGSIERTTRSMSRMGSTGEPTRHVCRHGVANGVSRVSSARFWCGCVNTKHPHDVACAGAGCRERQCLFCLLASAGSAGRCRKSISRRQPLSRRPPLCGPCGYCLRQTPSVPPIGYRDGLRSAVEVGWSGAGVRGPSHSAAHHGSLPS